MSIPPTACGKCRHHKRFKSLDLCLHPDRELDKIDKISGRFGVNVCEPYTFGPEFFAPGPRCDDVRGHICDEFEPRFGISILWKCYRAFASQKVRKP